MNPILYLFDKDFVLDFFDERLLPRYKSFKKVSDVDIRGIKEYIWEDTYHVVIEFTTTIESKEGKKITLPIYCSAHSSEPRKNVYDGMKFLWDNGFYKGKLTMPRPLFYSNKFKATFYRGISGDHLYRYIRDNNRKEIAAIVPKSAGLLAKLHSINIENARNFNRKNSRIETAIPGFSHIVYCIKQRCPEYHYFFKSIYNILIKKEKEFFDFTDKRWLVHGDAHPENIIKINNRKTGMIDFTDLCLADFTRDVGSFLQQLEYMLDRKMKDREFTEAMMNKFLVSYEKSAKIKIDDNLRRRIDVYYYWTMMRTATYHLIKEHPEPERAKPLINTVANAFNIKL